MGRGRSEGGRQGAGEDEPRPRRRPGVCWFPPATNACGFLGTCKSAPGPRPCAQPLFKLMVTERVLAAFMQHQRQTAFGWDGQAVAVASAAGLRFKAGRSRDRGRVQGEPGEGSNGDAARQTICHPACAEPGDDDPRCRHDRVRPPAGSAAGRPDPACGLHPHARGVRTRRHRYRRLDRDRHGRSAGGHRG
jgi:hypothetical protein